MYFKSTAAGRIAPKLDLGFSNKELLEADLPGLVFGLGFFSVETMLDHVEFSVFLEHNHKYEYRKSDLLTHVS